MRQSDAQSFGQYFVFFVDWPTIVIAGMLLTNRQSTSFVMSILEENVFLEGAFKMISFLLCLALLIGGYFIYGSLVDRTFGQMISQILIW